MASSTPDGEEVKLDWNYDGSTLEVSVDNSATYSNPDENTDSDGMLDHQEKGAGTDPWDSDTDGDGELDDPHPLVQNGWRVYIWTGENVGDNTAASGQ